MLSRIASLVLAASFICACTGDPEPATPPQATSESGDEPMTNTSATSQTTSSTSEGDEEESGEGEESETGEPPTGMCGERPERGVYADCKDNTGACMPEEACFEGEFICSPYCTTDQDCPALDGCTGIPTCIALSSSTRRCALQCDSDLDCPGELACLLGFCKRTD